tara:strand:+ start:437 stop:595 length:159 start_codon:yes stop_codon:yes gene_type:complete
MELKITECIFLNMEMKSIQYKKRMTSFRIKKGKWGIIKNKIFIDKKFIELAE